MDFSSAKNLLINQNSEEKHNLQELDAFFKARFESSDSDPEKRIESLFYLLIAKLKTFSLETPETRKYFVLFLREMEIHIANITKESISTDGFWEDVTYKNFFSYIGIRIKNISYRFRILENRIKTNHMKIFLKLCEYYIHTLAQLYKGIGMSDRVMELYIIRMNLRKNHAFFNKKF